MSSIYIFDVVVVVVVVVVKSYNVSQFQNFLSSVFLRLTNVYGQKLLPWLFACQAALLEAEQGNEPVDGGLLGMAAAQVPWDLIQGPATWMSRWSDQAVSAFGLSENAAFPIIILPTNIIYIYMYI